MVKRDSRRASSGSCRVVWWVEIPVWALCLVLGVLWLADQVPWWYPLAFPVALEATLFALMLMLRWFRYQKLFRLKGDTS